MFVSNFYRPLCLPFFFSVYAKEKDKQSKNKNENINETVLVLILSYMFLVVMLKDETVTSPLTSVRDPFWNPLPSCKPRCDNKNSVLGSPN